MPILKHLLALLSLLYASMLLAVSPTNEVTAPPVLKEWQAWVLADKQHELCPLVHGSKNNRECTWPGKLNLELEELSGYFQQSWEIYAPSWVTVPGNAANWPQKVTVNKKFIPVIEYKQQPSIFLEPGKYQVEGIFTWRSIPDYIPIPKSTGLVNVKVNKKQLTTARRDAEHRLWFKEQLQAASPSDNLEVQIYRLITDKVPLEIITYLDIKVSGKQRQEILGPVILPNFTAYKLQTNLAAQLDKENLLYLTVKPGRWVVEIYSRAASNVEEIDVPDLAKLKNWSKQEIWSYETNPSIRLVNIAGLNAVEPQQTNMPQGWQHLPAYLATSGKTLKTTTMQRGLNILAEPKLELNRELWLDFTGKQFIFNDKLAGELNYLDRLTTIPKVQLGRVEINNTPQLITTLPIQQQPEILQTGFETRNNHVNIEAVGAIAYADTLPAHGWDVNVEHLDATIHLPPQHKIIYLGGVDSSDAWINQWDFRSIFAILAVTLLIYLISNWQFAVITLATFVVLYHDLAELWVLWLIYITMQVLYSWSITPKKCHNYINLTQLILGCIIIGYALMYTASNLQGIFYPTLTPKSQPPELTVSIASDMATELPRAEPQIMAKAARNMELLPENMSMVTSEPKFLDETPAGLIQTGPGVPSWYGNTYRYSLNGPINTNQEIRMYILTPLLSNIFSIFKIICMLLFTYLLANLRNIHRFFCWVIICSALFNSTINNEAIAESIPSQELLNEYQRRLLQPPNCIPNCATLSDMLITLNDQNIEIEFDVNNYFNIAIPLPGGFRQWLFDDIRVNGKSNALLATIQHERLWLMLNSGQHRVKISGTIPDPSDFELNIPMKPKAVSVIAKDWKVSGLSNNTLINDRLFFYFTGTAANSESTPKLTGNNLPPFSKVTREFNFNNNWEIITKVVKLGPRNSSMIIAYPLLPHEKITSAGVEAQDKIATISMQANEDYKQFSSILPATDIVQLQSNNLDKNWFEIWEVNSNNLWNLEFNGIPRIIPEYSKQVRTWQPFPNEQLVINVKRPEPAAGNSLTIQRSDLAITPHKHTVDYNLELEILASQDHNITFGLPPDVIASSVRVNDQDRGFRLQANNLLVNIKKNRNYIRIAWQATIESRTNHTTAAIEIPQTSYNNSVHYTLSNDRWVLYMDAINAYGPQVLLWWVLALNLIIGLIASKHRLIHLHNKHWVGLAFGCTLISPWLFYLTLIWATVLEYSYQQRYRLLPFWLKSLKIITAIFTAGMLLAACYSIYHTFVGQPNMLLSTDNYNWYQDQVQTQLPQVVIVSIPMLFYRLILLLWLLGIVYTLFQYRSIIASRFAIFKTKLVSTNYPGADYDLRERY